MEAFMPMQRQNGPVSVKSAPRLKTLRDVYSVAEDEASWRFKLEIVRIWWFQERGGLGL